MIFVEKVPFSGSGGECIIDFARGCKNRVWAFVFGARIGHPCPRRASWFSLCLMTAAWTTALRREKCPTTIYVCAWSQPVRKIAHLMLIQVCWLRRSLGCTAEGTIATRHVRSDSQTGARSCIEDGISEGASPTVALPPSPRTAHPSSHSDSTDANDLPATF